MFAKPLDPVIKARLYDNLNTDPDAAVVKCLELLKKDLKTGHFE